MAHSFLLLYFVQSIFPNQCALFSHVKTMVTLMIALLSFRRKEDLLLASKMWVCTL